MHLNVLKSVTFLKCFVLVNIEHTHTHTHTDTQGGSAMDNTRAAPSLYKSHLTITTTSFPFLPHPSPLSLTPSPPSLPSNHTHSLPEHCPSLPFPLAHPPSPFSPSPFLSSPSLSHATHVPLTPPPSTHRLSLSRCVSY